MVIDKDRLYRYGTLAGIVAVAVTTVVDYKTSVRLSTDPRARPEAFTASDGRRLHDEFDRHLEKSERRCRERADKMQRTIEQQQQQILHLYEEVYNKKD